MNQNCLKEEQHDNTIVQITSLAKLEHKYFATRCADGDVGLYSSNVEPDQVYMFENVDQGEDEITKLTETHRESRADEEPAAPEQVEENEEEQNPEEGEEEEPELDENGDPIVKKPKVVEPPKKKDKSGRISSKEDQMIEIDDWKLTQTQASTAVLCFSNYRQSFISIASFDLKTRRKLPLRTYNLANKPTKLFKLDHANILVGTENGKIEHWTAHTDSLVKSYDAHPESETGISILMEVHSKSKLLRHALPDKLGEDFRLLATASAGSNLIKLWKVDKDLQLHEYLQIKTSLSNIDYLVEMSDNQLIAANKSTIKMLNFIDKAEKESAAKNTKYRADVQTKMKEIFVSCCKEMKADKQTLKKYFEQLHKDLGTEF